MRADEKEEAEIQKNLDALQEEIKNNSLKEAPKNDSCNIF